MEKKTDRRVLRTRKMLLEGLTDLLKEKDIKDISVKELADYADINRCTFYLHYKDVYDMLEKIEMEFVDDFNTMLDSCIESTPDPYPFMCAFLSYSYEHQETLSAKRLFRNECFLSGRKMLTERIILSIILHLLFLDVLDLWRNGSRMDLWKVLRIWQKWLLR